MLTLLHILLLTRATLLLALFVVVIILLLTCSVLLTTENFPVGQLDHPMLNTSFITEADTDYPIF